MASYKPNKKTGLYPPHTGSVKNAASIEDIQAMLDVILIKLNHPKLYGTIRTDINFVKHHYCERLMGFHCGCSQAFLDLKEKNGKTATLEHAYTATEELKDILRLKIDNRYDLLMHIYDNYSMCFITKEEDKALRDHHYTTTRPGGWRKCYEECGIKIAINPGK